MTTPKRPAEYDFNEQPSNGLPLTDPFSLGNLARMEDEAGWQRFSFEGRPTSRGSARRDRLLSYEAWAASAAHQPMALRIPLNISGSLAFLVRRQIVRDVRSVAGPRDISVRPERRFNPRWIELRRSGQSRS